MKNLLLMALLVLQLFCLLPWQSECGAETKRLRLYDEVLRIPSPRNYAFVHQKSHLSICEVRDVLPPRFEARLCYLEDEPAAGLQGTGFAHVLTLSPWDSYHTSRRLFGSERAKLHGRYGKTREAELDLIKSLAGAPLQDIEEELGITDWHDTFWWTTGSLAISSRYSSFLVLKRHVCPDHPGHLLIGASSFIWAKNRVIWADTWRAYRDSSDVTKVVDDSKLWIEGLVRMNR